MAELGGKPLARPRYLKETSPRCHQLGLLLANRAASLTRNWQASGIAQAVVLVQTHKYGLFDLGNFVPRFAMAGTAISQLGHVGHGADADESQGKRLGNTKRETDCTDRMIPYIHARQVLVDSGPPRGLRKGLRLVALVFVSAQGCGGGSSVLSPRTRSRCSGQA